MDTIHPLHLFQFCPICGSPKFVEHNVKSKHCANCGFTYYFNPSAATVAFIVNDKNELLVCRRAKDPAKGTLDLPGGFIDMGETGEEGVIREIAEETALKVTSLHYLFSLPNTYLYSGFLVHTLDQFFLCKVDDFTTLTSQDDVADSFFIPFDQINASEFGLDSVQQAITHFLAHYAGYTPPSPATF